MDLERVFSFYGSSFIDDLHATKPWRHGDWVWATQGHLVVALKPGAVVVDAVDTPDRFVKAADRMLVQLPPERREFVDLKALRAFAGGVADATAECDTCHGEGRVFFQDRDITCEHCGRPTRVECHECGGSGYARIERRYRRVLGLPINCTLLAFGLSFVPSVPRCDGWRLYQHTGGYSLVLDGGEWRVLLMQLKETKDQLQEFFPGPHLVAEPK